MRCTSHLPLSGVQRGLSQQGVQGGSGSWRCLPHYCIMYRRWCCHSGPVWNSGVLLYRPSTIVVIERKEENLSTTPSPLHQSFYPPPNYPPVAILLQSFTCQLPIPVRIGTGIYGPVTVNAIPCIGVSKAQHYQYDVNHTIDDVGTEVALCPLL